MCGSCAIPAFIHGPTVAIVQMRMQVVLGITPPGVPAVRSLCLLLTAWVKSFFKLPLVPVGPSVQEILVLMAKI